MSDQLQLAERIRDACVRAALAAHEDAGISGLCMEGRWEIAVQAIRTLDLASLLERLPQDEGF
jgi:hypothetical protein